MVIRCVRVLVAAVILLGISAAGASEPEEWQTFPHPAGGFSVSLPPRWSVEWSGDQLRAKSPDDDIRLAVSGFIDPALTEEALFLAVTDGAGLTLQGTPGHVPDLNGLSGWVASGVTAPADGSATPATVVVFAVPNSSVKGFMLVAVQPGIRDSRVLDELLDYALVRS